MATLVTSFEPVTFITKLKTIALSSDISCSISLSVDNIELLNEIYYPNADGNIILYEVDKLLTPYLLQTLTANITLNYDDESVSFIALYTSADIVTDSATFLRTHFLTHLTEKITNISFREYLYFFTIQGGGNYPIVQCLYDDGSTNQTTLTNVAQENIIAVLDVSPSNFAISGKKLIKYNVACGLRRVIYDVSNEYVSPAPQLIFRNSFGCEETIYCIGTHSLEPEYNNTTALVEGDFKNIDIEENKVFKAYTGILSSSMSNWADDLFRSNSIRLFTIDNGLLNRGKEITITSAKAIRSNEYSFLPNFYFEYRYAQRIHNIFDNVKAGRIFDNTFDFSYE